MKNLSGSKTGIFWNCGWWARDDVSYPPRGAGHAADIGSACHEVSTDYLASTPDVERTAKKYNVAVAEFASHFEAMKPELDKAKSGAPLCEPAFAFNVKTREARLLGLNIERKYKEHGAGPDDIPLAIDLVYTNEVGQLVIVDYKTGYADHVDEVERNKQLLLGGLCAAKHTGNWNVRLELWFIRPGRVWKEHADVNLFDLRAFEDGLIERVKRLPIAPAIAGDHCRYCPANGACPETQRQLAQVAPSPIHRWSTEIVDGAHAAWMAENLPLLKKATESIEDALKAHSDRIGGIPLQSGKVWRGVECKRSGLNMQAVKEHLGEQYESFTTTTTFKRYQACKP